MESPLPNHLRYTSSQGLTYEEDIHHPYPVLDYEHWYYKEDSNISVCQCIIL